MQRLSLTTHVQFELHTDYSRSLSLSILDEHLNDISISINDDNPIEMFITRDQNLVVSPMIYQNVSAIDRQHPFYLQLIHLSDVSLHFEMQPINIQLSYLFIYRFDDPPRVVAEVDHWELFCSQGKALFGSL